MFSSCDFRPSFDHDQARLRPWHGGFGSRSAGALVGDAVGLRPRQRRRLLTSTWTSSARTLQPRSAIAAVTSSAKPGRLKMASSGSLRGGIRGIQFDLDAGEGKEIRRRRPQGAPGRRSRAGLRGGFRWVRGLAGSGTKRPCRWRVRIFRVDSWRLQQSRLFRRLNDFAGDGRGRLTSILAVFHQNCKCDLFAGVAWAVVGREADEPGVGCGMQQFGGTGLAGDGNLVADAGLVPCRRAR